MNPFAVLSSLSFSSKILLLMVVTSVACALLGNFLVLRRLSMVSDALAHSVLLGIVLAYFATHNLHSPLLIVGAALFGVVTVFCIVWLSNTGLVKNDDAVGIVFPLFFSLAVLLITRFARNVHIDTDMVLMGEALLAPLHTMTIAGIVVPKSLVFMSVLLVVNVLFLAVFYKELKVTTFDPAFAALAGFSSTALFYAFMTLTSFTTVIAFDAVGAVLVVSFLVTPAASAYLLTRRLRSMLLVSGMFAVVNAVLGFRIAMAWNLSLSGTTASVAGLTFLLTCFLHPGGWIAKAVRSAQNRRALPSDILLMHIGNHAGTDRETEEIGRDTIGDHLKWNPDKVAKHIRRLLRRGMIVDDPQRCVYCLTERGQLRYNTIKAEYGV